MITVLRQRSLKYFYKSILQTKKILKMRSIQSEYYFGYGANLNSERYSMIGIEPKIYGNAKLLQHNINFSLPTEYLNKSYAGVHFENESEVPGLLIKLDAISLKYLDVLEWCGFGAYKRSLEDIEFCGKTYKAWVYKVSSPDFNRSPSKVYLEKMIETARDRQFDNSYIEKLEKTKYQEYFEIDPYFSLATYSSSRSRSRVLKPFFRVHDIIREKICSLI